MLLFYSSSKLRKVKKTQSSRGQKDWVSLIPWNFLDIPILNHFKAWKREKKLNQIDYNSRVKQVQKAGNHKKKQNNIARKPVKQK